MFWLFFYFFLPVLALVRWERQILCAKPWPCSFWVFSLWLVMNDGRFVRRCVRALPDDVRCMCWSVKLQFYRNVGPPSRQCRSFSINFRMWTCYCDIIPFLNERLRLIGSLFFFYVVVINSHSRFNNLHVCLRFSIRGLGVLFLIILCECHVVFFFFFLNKAVRWYTRFLYERICVYGGNFFEHRPFFLLSKWDELTLLLRCIYNTAMVYTLSQTWVCETLVLFVCFEMHPQCTCHFVCVCVSAYVNVGESECMYCVYKRLSFCREWGFLKSKCICWEYVSVWGLFSAFSYMQICMENTLLCSYLCIAFNHFTWH